MDIKLLDVGIFNNSNLEFSKTYLNSEDKELSLLVRNNVPFSIGIEKAAFEPFQLSLQEDEDVMEDIQLKNSF